VVGCVVGGRGVVQGSRDRGQRWTGVVKGEGLRLGRGQGPASGSKWGGRKGQKKKKKKRETRQFEGTG
jgi:hypothetical protein